MPEESSRTASRKERYKKIVLDHGAVDRLLVEVFLKSHQEAPKEIILDLDATDDSLHGKQEGRFFGYYGHYCYLPLYIFCGEFLLCARLRSSNIDASEGSVEELQRIVEQIRSAWPVRGDSGFCREELMAWCEANRVPLVFSTEYRKFMNVDKSLMVQFLPLGLQIPEDHPDRNRYLSLNFRKRANSSDVAELTLMRPVDILFLYTDGVYGGSDRAGRQQFEQLMREHYQAPTNEICNTLLEYALKQDERFRETGEEDRIDDETVFNIKRS